MKRLLFLRTIGNSLGAAFVKPPEIDEPPAIKEKISRVPRPNQKRKRQFPKPPRFLRKGQR